MKRCSRCGVEKPLARFGFAAKSKDGLNHYCRDCNTEVARAWQVANPERRKATSRKSNAKKHGLTLAEYDALVARPCDICGTTERQRHADHSHASGEVRGSLCFDCNTGIGKLGDTLEGVLRAVRYLEAA